MDKAERQSQSKSRLKWQSIFSKLGWDLIALMGTNERFFEGEEKSNKASFFYGDFEEFCHLMSIKIAMD
jgi:hypothetical protein